MSLKDIAYPQGYPVCAEPPKVRRGGFRDIDEQAAQLAGHDQVYQQISPGAFHGRFLTADIGRGGTLFIEDTNQALLQNGSVPAGQTSFLFLLGHDQRCRFQSSDLTSIDLAVMPPLSSFSVHCPADTSFCVVTLDDSLSGEMPWPDPASLPAGAFRLQAKQIELVVGALRYLVRTWLSLFDEPVPGAGNTAALLSLRRSLVATLELALSTHCDRLESTGANLAVEARRVIDRKLREIDVLGLSSMLGVPRRTLEAAFRKEFGIGPSRYIKIRRLNEIRRELLTASRSTIADIAARWGLWHPSHFSESYAMLFHELPSETRAGVAADLAAISCRPAATRRIDQPRTAKPLSVSDS